VALVVTQFLHTISMPAMMWGKLLEIFVIATPFS